MYNIKQTIGAIGLAFAVGCSGNPTLQSETTQIRARPISVATGYNRVGGDLATVIEDLNGRPVMAGTYCKKTSDCVKGEAIIQSEINDGDQETIVLNGEFRDDYFKIDQIVGNGLKATFRR